MKKITISLILILIIGSFLQILSFATTNNISKKEKNSSIFYDDFSSGELDSTKWIIANKAWGENNGGVVPQNIKISNGTLKLEGHGDKYTGDVEGINRPNGTRTGAAIMTKEYYGSGSYEVVAKVAPYLGACSAIWTFEYEEYYPGDDKYKELAPDGVPYYVVNHEIDIEMPGRPSTKVENVSYEYALCNTWVGEREGEHTTGYTKLPSAQNDGVFHKYRFDWHTGDENETPRVEFYIDDVLVRTNTTHIPTNKGRLWIGLWFPNGWAETPDFDTAVFEIDSVKITPFNESGDTEPNERWEKPTSTPTVVPTATQTPSTEPTLVPTNIPIPTIEPTKEPTIDLTIDSTDSPTVKPTVVPAETPDNTISTERLPQTGVSPIPVYIILIPTICAIVCLIKYKL